MKPFPRRLASVFYSPFFKGSFTYLSGSILNSALPLLVMPLLTRYLTPDDYGVMATSTVLTQIFVLFIGINAYGLMARSHFDNNPKTMRELVSTSLWLSLSLALALLALTPLLGHPIERLTQFPAAWLPAVILLSLMAVVQGNYLALVQARSEPLRYIVLQSVAGMINLGLSVFFVVQLHMDWRGRMWALMAAQFLISTICIASFVHRLKLLRPVFNRESCRSLMSFGVPLIPHAIGGLFMTMAGRIYLNNMASVAETGLYSVAFNLTSPICMIVGAANNAYMPTLFKHLSTGGSKLRLCKILLLVSFALPVLALVCAVSVRGVLPFIVGKRFYGAASYVGWMALTYAVQGIYFIFGNFVVYSKRTSLMTWRADFLGGIVLLVACPLLIKWNGPIGAAQATCLAFTASTVGCITASRKACPMPWAEALQLLFNFRRRTIQTTSQ